MVSLDCSADSSHVTWACLSVSQVSSDGALRDASVPLAVLVSRVPARSPDTERVSTGTKFALELWQRGLHTFEP